MIDFKSYLSEYKKKVWADDDVITAQSLNNLEIGVTEALAKAAQSLYKSQEAMDSTVKMESGYYNGTNQSGLGNENTLTFSFKPKIVIIVERVRGDGDSRNGINIIDPQSLTITGFYSGETVDCRSLDNSLGTNIVSFDGNTLSWCYPFGYSSREGALAQMNALSYEFVEGSPDTEGSGFGYYYFAFK